ncbi:MAG: DUF4405 domain-containing protein [Chlorobium phaeobacteroides]|nr:DUF4405 domain-containing protein [Chlorobium phaeobacteroides]MBL6956277.1 DUF4405 domain-containing protein [Chlorobium phaeobacteroides]
MMNTTLRSLATPLIAAAFLVSASTGLMMFFHFEPGIVEPVHEWMSWILVGGAVLHLLANWKAFTGYLQRKTGVVFIGAAIAIALLSLYPWVEEGEDGRKKAVKSLEKASLITISGVAGTSLDQLLETMSQNGISVLDTGDSIEEIAEQNDMEEKALFGVIFE